MKYVKIVVGLLFMLGSLLSFGASCMHGASNRDWLSVPGSLRVFPRFGQCVADIDRLFDRTENVAALGLAVALFVIGVVFLLAARSKKPQAPLLG